MEKYDPVGFDFDAIAASTSLLREDVKQTLLALRDEKSCKASFLRTERAEYVVLLTWNACARGKEVTIPERVFWHIVRARE